MAVRNLLDNSDFTNLVAQAGYLGTHAGNRYLADRWIVTTGGDLIYDAGTRCVTFNPQPNTNIIVDQVVDPNHAGKTVTFAIKASQVVGIICLSEFNSAAGHADIAVQDGITTHTFVLGERSGVRIWSAMLSSMCIEWAALYEGAYTAETLPTYVPKGYGVELAECLRYFERIDAGFGGCFMPSGAKYCEIFVPCALKRIDNPAVNINDGVQAGVLTMRKCSDGSMLGSLWNASVTGYGYSRGVSVKFTTNDAPSMDCYVSLGGSSSGNFYIDISCDL